MPARGFAAFGVAIRIDSLLLSAVAQPLAALLPYGCGSADLVEVQPNFRLLWICTILLMPAKAALLRSPHFNRKNDRVSGRFRSFYQFVPEDNRR